MLSGDGFRSVQLERLLGALTAPGFLGLVFAFATVALDHDAVQVFADFNERGADDS